MGTNLKKSELSRAIAMASAAWVCTSLPVAAQTNADTTDNEITEEVMVYGVRQSLETALEVKRNTTAIVDHIDSEDIAGFPALDLGESLQAIPGIQVNRESERRQSEISMRGLPGGYVLKTVNGQDFANPTRSFRNTSPSPLGAFESSVFKGVSVYKSQQADLMEGGIAGVISKKLPNALSSKGTGGNVRGGYRYEQLNDSYDPEIAASFHHHLIEDELAVYAIFAGSEQNFRRDSINITSYQNLGATQFPDYETWRVANNIPDNTAEVEHVVKVPDNIRQFTEINNGDRFSFTGNIGWQATDELTLSVDLLATRRDMEDSTLEIGSVSLGRSQTSLTPTTNPFFVGNDTNLINPNGTPAPDIVTYGVGGIEYENAQSAFGNRTFKFFEATRGVFLNAKWESGPWEIDGHITSSKADNNFIQTNLQTQIRPSNADPDGNNGVNGSIFTGEDNYEDFAWSMDNPRVFEFLNQDFPDISPTTQSFNVRNTGPDALNGGDERLYVAGGRQTVDRTLQSADASVLYQFEDVAFISSVKSGIRFAKDSLDNEDFQASIASINQDNVSNDFYQSPYYTRSTGFFNGNAPNFLSYERGWLSLREDYMTQQLQEGMDERLADGRTRIPGSGFVARNIPNDTSLSRNFTADLSSTALFAMVNLDQPLSNDFHLSGNIGVRYIDSSTENEGLSIEYDEFGDEVQNTLSRTLEYSNTLPSMNLVLSAPSDVIVRFAASRGMVRPNLRANTPAVTQRLGEQGGRDAFLIDLPKDQVKPFTADSFDLSFEWYNREGSALALALYQKTIKGFIQTTKICPSSGVIPIGGVNIDIGSTLTPSADGVYCELDNPITIDADPDAAVVDPTTYVVADIDLTTNSDEERKLQGVEFIAQQDLSFLPEPWSGFGGQFNYTHVEDKGEAVVDGISEDSFNIISYWENETWSARFSYNWRSSYTLGSAGGGSFGGAEARQVRPRGQLDFSLSYRATDDIRINFKAFNLTDVMYREFQGTHQLPRRTNYDGRTYALNASYSF